MANPQPEDGHIDIANEIADKFCSYRLSGEEWQVLWVIVRKTYGWHKKEDNIGFGQFSEMTGMTRQHALRALKKLESKGIIGVTKKGNSGINCYNIIKNFDKWKVLPKKVTVLPKLVGGVTKIGFGVLPKKGHTKENIQKKIQKKILIPIPEDFEITERVKAWALKKNFDQLEEHLESFKLSCAAKNYQYADWDAAFMGAIRADWAKIRSGGNNGRQGTTGSTGTVIKKAGRAESDGAPYPVDYTFGE